MRTKRKRTRSVEGESYQHWYRSERWKKLRQKQLDKHPLCQCPHCRDGKGKFTEATVVDHIIPHKGSKRLFFDPANLRSMGKLCHDKFKQSEERGGHGFLTGCDEHGIPLSREHHWHTEG